MIKTSCRGFLIMGSQWGRDGYYRKARKEGYRSRAAYKLLDIQKRFQVIRDDDNVIDLGCAPGSWLQVLHELTDGQVIGIDLNPVPSVEGVVTLTGDFTTEYMHEKVRSLMSEANVIVCDASPNLSKNKNFNQARSVEPSEKACNLTMELLILEKMRRNFFGVKVYRSKAARKGSTEVYIVGKKFKGRQNDSEG
jgi:23S rRNA (uridine2552-2'-O)-methyltransferase